MSERPQDPEMVLCIPGPWENTTELIRRLIQHGDGYLFAGRILMHTETRFSCELIFEGPDERMSRAFWATAPHWRDSAEMTAIATHRSVVYLVGPGGSQQNAESLMQAGAALVRAGGLGVKVESTGLSHTPSAWLDHCAHLYLFFAHRALVIYLTGEDVCSCGMHNLGLKDAVTGSLDDPTAATELLRAFTHYLFTEQPTIRHGQTFSVAADARVYRIEEESSQTYEEDSLFHNPYGLWRLVPLAG
ncbi:DUF4261 domain-containing protein [Variovorax sp. KBW07]|uniref:DUF4261 domain-containing protein n=1 Tax=Variovorax sp. KBW07 TaxID=2153358 RepID=UPI001C891571|nr:DUF4261 domain-containing protein [Variovorax sp. KBW07]